MIDVDQAEPVALGVGNDDEVRIVRPVIPIDHLPAEIANNRRCRLLVVDTMDGNVQVHAGERLHRCRAQLEGQDRASTAVFERAPTRAPMLVGRPDVEQRAPEADRTVKIINA